MATFGEILQELRKDRGLSQKQLAGIMSVTVGTISNYENDRHLPDVEKLILLSEYFNVTTDYLLGRAVSDASPDIFQEQLAPGKSVGALIDDFRKLSGDRQQALMLVLQDMMLGALLSSEPGRERL